MKPSSHTHSTFRWLAALIAIVAVGVLWEEFAPTKLGGSHDYAVVDGISMNPKLHAGDLVLLRQSSSYQVGDVVGYHNLQLGRLVLHRIVGKVGDRYVFKGDNNDFLDSYHPTQDQLVGRLWFHVPKVGGLFTWLHAPHHAGITVAIVAFLLLAGGGAGAARRRRHRPTRLPVATNPTLGRALVSSAAPVALVFGLVTLIAFSHSTTSTTDTPGAYVQQGAYGYSAHVQPNALYPSGRLSTGQTVFTRLVHRVATGFDYRFVSALPHSVGGTARFAATLRSSNGWTKQLHSQTLRFSGDHVRLSGALDVDSLEQQVERYAKLTGIGNDSFDVVLAPTIAFRGTVAGASVSDSFAPTPLDFALDGYALRLQQSPVAPTQPGAATTPDVLHPSEPGVIPHRTPATVKLLVANARVSTARSIGLVGFAGAAALALLGLALLGRRQGDELATIRRRGGSLLVPVSSPPAAPAGGYVDVANFDSLAHLARSYQLVILHHQRGEAHSFYIDDDGSMYRYSVRAGERHAQAG